MRKSYLCHQQSPLNPFSEHVYTPKSSFCAVISALRNVSTFVWSSEYGRGPSFTSLGTVIGVLEFCSVKFVKGSLKAITMGERKILAVQLIALIVVNGDLKTFDNWVQARGFWLQSLCIRCRCNWSICVYSVTLVPGNFSAGITAYIDRL